MSANSLRSVIRPLAVICSLGLVVMAGAPAMARDIKSQLPVDLVADHCITNGVGSDTEGTFILPNGSRVSGTVRCDANDLRAAPPSSTSSHDSDDRNGSEGSERGGEHSGSEGGEHGGGDDD